jgi:ATP-dependent Clp protease ATP-binding subunit ClpA
VGILENPWAKASLRDRLAEAQERIGRRIRGQDEAVRRSVDILVRSVMGLSGAQASAEALKPRGVLFFAGLTGVGKTELAKALTELVFGDERAYIRFDMSEFSAEHASERLVGAPPGYLGHDAGGELTNAVRKRV